MHVGLALPQYDISVPGERPLRWDTVAGWARRAEELGFSSVWLSDHLFWDISRYGGSSDLVGSLDPLVALGALARHTSRVRLGTLTACTPLRSPVMLAKALATIDVLSEGRLVVGMGAGWYEPEFSAAGVAFEPAAVRLARLGEAVDVLKGMFGGGPFTFEGHFYRTSSIRGLPTPVQRPHPPIWIGGKGGPRLLDLVAGHADGWNTVWTWSPGAYRERCQALDAACERAGRDPATVARSLGLYALVGEDDRDLARRFERLRASSPPGVLDRVSLDDWRRDRLVGTVAEVREQVAAWAAEGVSELIVCPGAVPFSVGAPGDLDMVAAACSLGADA